MGTLCGKTVGDRVLSEGADTRKKEGFSYKSRERLRFLSLIGGPGGTG